MKKTNNKKQYNFTSLDIKNINRAVMENIFEAVIITDFMGKVLFANSVAKDMFGFKSNEDIYGINSLNFVAPKYRKNIIKDLALDKSAKAGHFPSIRLLRRMVQYFGLKLSEKKLNIAVNSLNWQ